MKKIIKTILEVLTSSKLVGLFDADGNGEVSWKEFKEAPASVKARAVTVIIADVASKHWWWVFTFIL